VRMAPEEDPSRIDLFLKRGELRYTLSSQIQTAKYNEVIYELALSDKQRKLVGQLKHDPAIQSVSLVDSRMG